jgi:hypothetical protein
MILGQQLSGSATSGFPEIRTELQHMYSDAPSPPPSHLRVRIPYRDLSTGDPKMSRQYGNHIAQEDDPSQWRRARRNTTVAARCLSRYISRRSTQHPPCIPPPCEGRSNRRLNRCQCFALRFFRQRPTVGGDELCGRRVAP